eukprot:TRINITY_DN66579_c0_g1_i1.p1 TRINITY_DN66579_c0_g1~~TRINITY_DN66579_c0_g1_i1.p1  ORF type:complete len:149 (+),score=37.65 TRINITY_DN66579_c0_g1_i1:74-520(+)
MPECGTWMQHPAADPTLRLSAPVPRFDGPPELRAAKSNAWIALHSLLRDGTGPLAHGLQSADGLHDTAAWATLDRVRHEDGAAMRALLCQRAELTGAHAWRHTLGGAGTVTYWPSFDVIYLTWLEPDPCSLRAADSGGPPIAAAAEED